MKFLTLFFLLAPGAASADARVTPYIDHALGITETELGAIHSGQYQYYRPETIRSIITQLLADERSAATVATDEDGRQALRDLDRSLDEEFQYSFRFQYYRLASTELLVLNWARLFRLARDSELANDNPLTNPATSTPPRAWVA